MYDFFISHSSKDKIHITDELVNQLEHRGYKVWYDKNEILVSDNILEMVKKGLKCSYCIILVVTDNFFESKWTFYETGLFDASNNNSIIPLLYDVSEINRAQLLSIIGNRKYLDMNSIASEVIVAELSKILKRTQEENKDIKTIEELKNIQKRLAAYETVNAEIISINIKEYLSFLETNKDYLILAAKKIVKNVSVDLLRQKNVCIDVIENFSTVKLLENNNIGSINFREYVEFILSGDCEKYVNNDYLVIVNNAIFNILTYYIHSRYPASLSFNQIEVALPEELTYSDFQDMYEIDKKVMREDLIADTETTYGWYKHNKYTHIGVRDVVSKKIIGYFSVLPINDKVYVAGVGIDPEYQNTGAFIMLYNALIDLVIILAKEREIYISEVLAEASTKQGEKFCKMVGMKKIATTDNETDIYRLITIPPEFRHTSQKGKELFKLCETKFEEYREYFQK